VERPSGTLDPGSSERPDEPRQRWRITFARDASAEGDRPVGRAYVGVWEEALIRSGLPVAIAPAGRPKLALAAALPAGVAGRAELVDVWLTERTPAWRVREALQSVLPQDHRFVRCEDVWLAAPALAGRVAGADYVVDLMDEVDRGLATDAAAALLASTSIPRTRQKGSETKTFDLRPLLIAIRITDEAGEPNCSGLRIRTRIHPELGTGRPEEVVAAFAERLGIPVAAGVVIRDRLLLTEDVSD